MKPQDAIAAVQNPRLLSAIYFGLLAIIATVLIDAIFYLTGAQELIPTFKSVLLATFTAVIFGGLFGKKIVQCHKPYRFKAFLWGFLMIIAALPFYNLFFLWLSPDSKIIAFANASFQHWLVAYLVLIAYSFFLAGLWLAILAGFAAMYLRGQFVYDIMNSEENDARLPKRHK